ncbi:acetyltransferase [Microbispora hainanensis]|uniref:GNAT family N-acetyltransferase n=1 Tax=Microbispora TaxID=2005 RepID=UPI001158C5E8|nr:MULTISPECIES: GNAT family N-acetyltransferase [Microbispora]NJP27594.1 acetyltransferase [Microbispora sp. CL1-1]TQS10841.1 acetyltransferase [Microbispora sp. SCL1-1]
MTTEAHTTAPARRAAVWEQTVEGFGTFRIVPVDPPADADLIHSWVTEERARFWGMLDASRERVLEIYDYLDGLATHHAYLVCRDDRPVALFQTYEPEADPVGECYDVQPGDFGVHLLVGPATGKGERGFTPALLSVLLAYVFADPRHTRIVAEPDTRNDKVIDRMLRTGFTLGPEIDLPDKRARLLFLARDHHR